jgi:hypothetical protein
MTTYTIRIVNQSGGTESYVVFLAPPGGETPVHANVWVTLENVTDGGYDSVVYTTPDITGDHDPVSDPASAGEAVTTFNVQSETRFYVSTSDYTPGQVIDPSQAPDTARIDFAGRPDTATVTRGPDGGVSAQSETSFYVSNSDYMPGRVIDPSQTPNTIRIDFAGQPDTATVIQGADGGFSVDYG